jgi:5-methylcytosine-specific restriction endonuclease McrA
MSPARSDPPRLRMDPVSYETLRRQVLRRDGWRCQSCGTMLNLEVHHQRFRSHSGDDSEDNLITLCAACHNRTHNNVTAKRQNQQANGLTSRERPFDDDYT